MRPHGLLIVFVLAGAAAVAWVAERQFAPEPGAPAEKPVVEGSAGELIRALGAEPELDPRVVAMLKRLQEELDAQKQAQHALRAELDALGRELRTIPDIDTGMPAAGDTPEDGTTGSTTLSRWLGRGQATRKRMESVGFQPYQVERILATADRLEMQRLDLQYQARREGWADTERYAEALRDIPSLRDTLTKEYGDDAYDRYLYASGHPNRVVVRKVYGNSPASMAGLASGDLVIALDGQRVYSERDMREIATSGSTGDSIAVVVERDGARFKVYIPRGPLGARTISIPVAPD
jgi:hypothetical protein